MGFAVSVDFTWCLITDINFDLQGSHSKSIFSLLIATHSPLSLPFFNFSLSTYLAIPPLIHLTIYSPVREGVGYYPSIKSQRLPKRLYYIFHIIFILNLESFQQLRHLKTPQNPKCQHCSGSVGPPGP